MERASRPTQDGHCDGCIRDGCADHRHRPAPGGVDRGTLPAAIVAEQVASLLKGMPTDAIKIGMLGSTEIAEILIPLLETVESPVVVDPSGSPPAAQCSDMSTN